MVWSRDFEVCQVCGKTEFPHEALGVCKRCYRRVNEKSARNKWRKGRRHLNRLKYEEFKVGKKCLLCNENHPACLDFHHKDGTKKSDRISKMVGRVPWKRLLEEIEKCDILCANCHRKLHYPEERIG